MKSKMRRMIVGISFVSGLVLNPVLALDVSAQQTRPETFGRREFCQNRLGGENFARTELFFGLAKPGGEVTEAEFQGFVDHVVTPLFPAGLTLLAGAGQFQDESGTTAREGSKLLILLYPFDSESNGKIQQIRDTYKNNFQQQSVLRVDEQSCVSF